MSKEICVCSMVKDEIEILPAYYRYIKQWAKSWRILDHGSTDGTIEFLNRMKDKKEMDIKIYKRPLDDFNNDFYKEFNFILSKSNEYWTYISHIDEFSPMLPEAIKILKEEPDTVYMIDRFEITNLVPMMANSVDSFMRMFPSKWDIRFKENNHVHHEQVVIDEKYKSHISKIKIPYYHLGRVRNFVHVRNKEAAFESCSGNSILTSKYDEKMKIDAINNSFYIITDYRLIEMLL